ncbi:dienelactone hydrolase [Sulfitobacter sp. KE34]|uniref:Dienelactone hydrolase n=1 Tax=Sulfitobacter faviae TaxID=1775881 RepID=A0AAX3LSY7_9RHOB|nr:MULTISPECIES: dienelactone hydrolase [Sulfitobacter]MDF3350666.1 dienelactone hydrolase [Sulfitobacter sp. KE12]MDF3354131.1 dienelactone hydrolase [Sulfitobacter sp. KE27]MDF3357986.1 dienelactone hydrolase [Sulfitobacter sp. KE33]MDF3359860.1 dienelactone hydrolase [Sulfitobacter sp. Ks41]MDF3365203.1 dienelactone hydrolase [Sulfitobacter sp. Ks34]
MTTTALLAAGLTAGAAQAENRIDRQLPNAPELAAYGDHAVGVRTLEMVNPDQIDILAIDPAADKPEEMPRYDRPLTVEMYYPAAEGAEGETSFKAYLRDGTTEVTLEGQAMRDVDPAEGETFPLVLISHGYPGNRYLMSHLAENLASKGYVVASIDHTDSTYRTQAAFGSTLVNRSLDQLFVLEQMAQKAAEGGDFAGLYDAENTGLIGYSMGGYGAIITAGGGVTEASVGYTWGGPHGTLGIHQAGSETHDALPDPRIKTAVAFGPWGMNRGFWDAEGLAGVQIPMLFIAGSQDDVSLYENGIRAIWENTSNVDRALLTYMNAGHNAGAPMPAPEEAYYFSEDKGFNISEHYTDAVWDTARMNNIAQHFVTAWMDSHLKGEEAKAAYLDLVENSNDGVWSVEEDGTEKEDHSYWKGFPEGTAKGLMYEEKSAAE